MEQLAMPFEEEIEELEAAVDPTEGVSDLSDETVETACNALSFCGALHQMFVDNGMIVDDAIVDFDEMENLIDALAGELTAACMCLGTFNDTPRMLRTIGENLKRQNIPEVPKVVVKGFERLATRVEKTTQTIKVVQGVVEPTKEV